MDELKSWPERWENAVKLLNAYCTTHYIDMPGEESRKVADAINDILPFAVWAYNHSAPENKPLTLNDLRRMDGEPVWVETMGEYRIVYIGVENDVRLYSIFNTISAKHVLDNDGRIYARNPEQEATP